MSFASQLGATGATATPAPRIAFPNERTYRGAGEGRSRGAVTNSLDLERILALPRRTPPEPTELGSLVEKWTRKLERPDHADGKCNCRIRRLFPIQAWYLEEASTCQGVLGHAAVGTGKTGIDILLPMVVPGTRSAVLLIPPSLRGQFAKDIKEWAQHFVIPNVAGASEFYTGRPTLHVLAYSELSVARFATVLKAKAPDLIIADEAQFLKACMAVRTSRLLRYFGENPNTRFYAHSGSLTTRSLLDYGHLSALALHEGSPLPIDMGTLMEWCGALDPSPFPGPVGALRRLCRPDQTARAGFKDRLLATPGVVVTEDARLPTRLVFRERALKVPDSVKTHLHNIRDTGTRPDGEEFQESVQVAACLRQMAAGFYYFWRYPRGEPKEVIDLWFARRGEWNRAVRKQLQSPADHFDSPFLLANAARRALTGEVPASDAPVWHAGAEAYRNWKAVEETVEPKTASTFVDDFMVDDAVAWGREHLGIIWFDHISLGHRIASKGGFPYYGGGMEASEGILEENGNRTIVASIAAHGQGKNLQTAFSRNLITTFPANDGIVEQLVGRTHRYGQPQPVVTVDYYAHTQEEREALAAAQGHSRYVLETTGGLHKLSFAEWGKA